MIFNRFELGEQKSEETLRGGKNGLGFYDLVNCDVHSKLGSVTCNNALAEITGDGQPDENVIGVLDNSDNLYLLSTNSGKIWKKATNDAYSLVHTNTNGQGHKGGGYFNNLLWFFTAAKLGYSNGTTWTNDSHGTFGVGNANKPFLKTGVNRAFAYIGDGAQLARIDKDNIFSANVLEIPTDEIITDIMEWGDDIDLAAYISSTKPISKMYRWNQFGDTYYRPDLIPESFVAMLFESTRSNVLLALAGVSGLIMHYTGEVLSQLKELKNETVAINPYAKTIHQGRAYFAVGDSVYSLHASNPTLPLALVKEYSCSAGATATIDSLESNGTTLYATWHTSTDRGVDKIGATKAAAVLETPVIQGAPKTIEARYRSMPTGCSVSAQIKVDGGAYQDLTMIKEAEQMKYVVQGGIPSENVNFSQVKFTLNPNGANAPVISEFKVE